MPRPADHRLVVRRLRVTVAARRLIFDPVYGRRTAVAIQRPPGRRFVVRGVSGLPSLGPAARVGFRC